MPTNTSPTPIADALEPDTTTEPTPVESPAQWSPDITAINNAAGDPAIWARQFYELVGYTTGKWIDEGSIHEWLSSFARQVSAATYRSVFFSIANATVPADTSGDPALQLLQFRDDLARSYRHQAGL